MEAYVRHNPEFNLAICVTCQSGLPPNGVLRHVRKHHNATWVGNKKSLEEHVERMVLAARANLEYPEGAREAIEGIEIKDG
jgi:Orsellinic acid/F9775 biosynthesis cluster protein D